MDDIPLGNISDSIQFDPKIGFIIHNVKDLPDLDCFGRSETENSSYTTFNVNMKRMLIIYICTYTCMYTNIFDQKIPILCIVDCNRLYILI